MGNAAEEFNLLGNGKILKASKPKDGMTGVNIFCGVSWQKCRENGNERNKMQRLLLVLA